MTADILAVHPSEPPWLCAGMAQRVAPSHEVPPVLPFAEVEQFFLKPNPFLLSPLRSGANPFQSHRKVALPGQ